MGQPKSLLLDRGKSITLLLRQILSIGELKEDSYDDFDDDPGDDLPLPCGLLPLPRPLVTQEGTILHIKHFVLFEKLVITNFAEENTLGKHVNVDPRKDRNISYTFITNPISRDINPFVNMKQKHVDSLQLELFSMNIFGTLKSTKVQGKIKLITEQIAIDICVDHPNAFWNRKKRVITHAEGEDHPQDYHQDRHTDPLLTPQILRRGGMSLINLNSQMTQSAVSSSIYLEDILENSQLYARLREYLSQKQRDTFASIAKEDIDDIKSFEKRKEEPWKIFRRYLINGLYFPNESYKTRSYYETILINTSSVEFQHFLGYNTSKNVYNFTKMIIKQIISIEDWSISTMTERQIILNKVLYYNYERHKHTWFIKHFAKMTERQISLNKVPMNFTNRDYINVFDKVLYCNNERETHLGLLKFVQIYLRN
ncbi:hypothetical protein H5410_030981 [Solanum commersonii]|uniref:Uncharacterized protein n=1 Tax=Solanum commersonii TaxID=4109 RepID=A0A9J5YFU2_SOLCO|nr:hypothetical protein H5410_030981 [Solanum commersonii]